MTTSHKTQILIDALRKIAEGRPGASGIADDALLAYKEAKEYAITARTWYGKNGGEFKAELRNVETGFLLCAVEGTTWGSDAWSYAMRDAMARQWPEKFPPHGGSNPTIYFRDVCGVDYKHSEVSRKRDL